MRRELFFPGIGIDPRALSEEGKEVWAPSYVGSMLFVSNLGGLFHERKGDLLLSPICNGYKAMYIAGHGIAYLHHLVIRSFEPTGRKVIQHANKDKHDNRLCNLILGKGRKLLQEEVNTIRIDLAAGLKPSLIARNLQITTSLVAYYQTKFKQESNK